MELPRERCAEPSGHRFSREIPKITRRINSPRRPLRSVCLLAAAAAAAGMFVFSSTTWLSPWRRSPGSSFPQLQHRPPRSSSSSSSSFLNQKSHKIHDGQTIARSVPSDDLNVIDNEYDVEGEAAAKLLFPAVDRTSSRMDFSSFPAGPAVYAVYDSDKAVQYIGMSKQLRRSIIGHSIAFGDEEASDRISAVRVLPLPTDVTKEALQAKWEEWILEYREAMGATPIGNLPETDPNAELRWRGKAKVSRSSSISAESEGLLAPLLLTDAPALTSVEGAVEAVQSVVKSHPIVFFMKGTPSMPLCGFSARAVSQLKQVGAQYKAVNVLDVDGNPFVREAVKAYSQWPTIPQLFVNGSLLGGSDIINDLFQNRQLAETLRRFGDEEADAEGSADDADESSEVALVDDAKRRPTATSISKAISEGLGPLLQFRLKDDSAQHSGDAGALEMGLTSESHFRLDIASPKFRGLSPVKRQQLVFDVLKDVMPRIHAISLVTRTPEEI
mmetsp:Transcript_59703/g.131089  ORF Transcript_59703/g.131089 Transcript_59703/m.131089 type:complete len:500 (+) Transcript_59703:113-1612(+)